jgi:hypothetical protein
MNKDDMLLLLLALLLLAAVLVTIFIGGNRSRHGYGFFPPADRGPAEPIARHSRKPGKDPASGLPHRLHML